jgi:hypothetical protein
MEKCILRGLCVLLIGSCCYGQSLADAARENRKQRSVDESSTSKRVISTDDLAAPKVIRLIPGHSSSGDGTVVAPGRGKHNYQVILLDASRFENPGTIHVTVTVGDGQSEASFDLYPQDLSLPEEGMPNSLAAAHNVPRGSGAKLNYHFTHGAVFQLGAEGSWNARAGATNTYNFVVDVE